MSATTTSADVALVTGASGGFGNLIAKSLAEAGLLVFAGMRDIHDRNRLAAAALRAWARDEGHRLEVIELDVTSDTSVSTGIDAITATAGRIDVVVNNAGVAARGPLEAFSVEQVRDIFDTNVLGPLRVDKAVLPGMRERERGLLIYISSALGRILPGLGGPYAASKWALEGLAEGMGNQVEGFGIDVVIVEPGSYPTDALGKGVEPADRDVADAYRRHDGPIRAPDYGAEPPDPQEVADAILAAIRTPHGRRPRRVVVGSILTHGVEAYNRAYDEAKRALTTTIGGPGPVDQRKADRHATEN